MKIIFTSFIVLRSGTYFTAYNDTPKIVYEISQHFQSMILVTFFLLLILSYKGSKLWVVVKNEPIFPAKLLWALHYFSIENRRHKISPIIL